MTAPCTLLAQKAHYELRFTSLSNERRDFAFPCDETGQVDMDELTDRGRANYFYARAVVGRELSAPIVAPVSTDRGNDEWVLEFGRPIADPTPRPIRREFS